MNEVDKTFFDRELASFLPDRIYDAHCHWWPAEVHAFHDPQRDFAGRAEYAVAMRELHGGRDCSALVLAFAHPSRPNDAAACNAWVASQLDRQAGDRGLFFVRPTDDPEWLREQVRKAGLHGLKCYHTFASRQPTWNAEVGEYLPESIVRVAHEESWIITLHLVRPRAVADPLNLAWIETMCRRYPGMRLILAHAARGFQPAHNLEGIPALAGLDNLYFDTSANCEPIALQAVLRYCGCQRLLYGTDFPISHLRGKHVGAADSFLWIYEQAALWDQNQQRVEPVLIGLEHLRAVKWACWSERLSDSQVEDIFYGNAQKLLL